ncbi:TPA: hypothetical protein ACH3X3_004526 [Trebouxia sp. C0006]
MCSNVLGIVNTGYRRNSWCLSQAIFVSDLKTPDKAGWAHAELHRGRNASFTWPAKAGNTLSDAFRAILGVQSYGFSV